MGEQNFNKRDRIFQINKRKQMTIKELSDNELTLLSSLIKQNKDKLKEIITGANKVNDGRTGRLIEIVKLAMEIKSQIVNECRQRNEDQREINANEHRQ